MSIQFAHIFVACIVAFVLGGGASGPGGVHGFGCPFAGSRLHSRRQMQQVTSSGGNNGGNDADDAGTRVGEDNDILGALNSLLPEFHNQERGRRLSNALKKGVMTTCESNLSLCFLADEKVSNATQTVFPYLPNWDCTSHSMPMTTNRYLTTKEVSHISLSTYLLLSAFAEGEVPANATATEGKDINKFLSDVMDARLAQVNVSTFPDCPPQASPWSRSCWPNVDLLANEEHIVGNAVEMLARADPTASEGGGISPAALIAFARDTSPMLIENLRVAARDQIDTMHTTVMGWLDTGLIKSFEDITVAACTAHMSRKQDLAVQYLTRLLSLPAAEDVPNRMIVYDGESGLPGAMDQLAAALVDWDAGSAFFEDPGRLNRDALSDAATEYLNAFSLPGLPPPPPGGGGPSPGPAPTPVPPIAPKKDGGRYEGMLAAIFGILFLASAGANVYMCYRLSRHDQRFVSGVKMMFRRRRGSEELGEGRLLPLLEVD